MKRWARVSLKVLGGLLLGVVTLAAAWAAFNNRYTDDAPRPVPDALRVPPSSVPADRNAMFALMGMASPGDDAHAQGLRRWAAIDAGQMNRTPDDSAWDLFRDKTWHCDAETQDCVAQWTRGSEVLYRIVAQYAELGRRCEALARPGMTLEEPIPSLRAELRSVGDSFEARAWSLPIAPSINCLHWLQVRAVLAARSGDLAQTLGYLTQADALTVGMLDGARTLSGTQLAGELARRHWRVITDLAAARPAFAPDLRALLKPLSARSLDASHWMRTEAAFRRERFRETGCVNAATGAALERPWFDPAPFDTPMRCRTPFWSMPNASIQLMDAQWLQAVARAPAGPLEMLGWQPDLSANWPDGLIQWRNTVGRVMVAADVSSYDIYARKQASLLLLNEAARLALAAGEIAPDRRAEWLAAQPMDARLRERLSLDGDRIAARLWEPVSRQSTLHYPIPPGVTSADTTPGSRTGPAPTRS